MKNNRKTPVTNELTRRIPLAHPGRTAFFDTDTLFMGVGADFEFMQFAGIDQFVLTDETTGMAVHGSFDDERANRYIHELHHWYQLTGTTFGALILWLRFLRDAGIMGALEGFTPDDHHELRRVAAEGRPLLRIGRDLNREFTSRDETKLEVALDTYYSRLLAEKILLGRIPATTMRGLEISVASMINYAANDVAQFISSRQPNECLRISFLDCGPFVNHVVFDGGKSHLFDVWQIMEGAAFFNEYDYLAYLGARRRGVDLEDPDQEAEHRKRWNNPDNIIYKTALSIIAHAVGDDAYRTDLTNTMVALADIALNPPIPPVTAASTPSALQVDWTGVSPVARFVRACASLSEVGLCRWDASEQELSTYRFMLCEAANLFHAEKFPSIFDDVAPPSVPQGTSLERQYGYGPYLLGAVHNSWHLRVSEGAIVYAPGRPEYHIRQDFWRLFENNRGFMTPLLFKNPTGIFSYPNIYQDAAMDISCASFLHYSVQEWLAGGSPIDCSAFPREFAALESGIVGDVKRTVRRLFSDDNIIWRN